MTKIRYWLTILLGGASFAAAEYSLIAFLIVYNSTVPQDIPEQYKPWSHDDLMTLLVMFLVLTAFYIHIAVSETRKIDAQYEKHKQEGA